MKHKVRHVHLVGIGGAGMSGIAEVLLNLGYAVSGSDLGESTTTARLRRLGAQVFHGHEAGHIRNADVVVTSTAVKDDNPEVQAAREARIPVVARAMMLSELMRFKQGIAVAGTHGKTTTTSLIASVLSEAGLDPTFVIGGKLLAAGANARLGQGEYLVAEADESDASFLHLNPVISVVTNIDQDHMETYGHDFERLKTAFVEFVHRLPFWGRAMLCADDTQVRELLPRITKPVTTYGTTEDCSIQAVDIRSGEGGRMYFTALRNGERSPIEVALNLPGMHNVLNALAAVAVAWELQLSDRAVQTALANFSGVGRRFQRYGEIRLPDDRTFTLVDDYGHHPAEMTATLAAARGAFPDRRLVLVFQPHRYTRTRDLFEDFVLVLSQADVLLLTEVYAAGEAPVVAADGRSLARAVRVAGRVEPVFVPEVQELVQAVLDMVRDGDVVLTMGAGSIGQLPAQLAALDVSHAGVKTQAAPPEGGRP
jgi:UDP-N-acetylmuramate--alanine ligase